MQRRFRVDAHPESAIITTPKERARPQPGSPANKLAGWFSRLERVLSR